MAMSMDELKSTPITMMSPHPSAHEDTGILDLDLGLFLSHLLPPPPSFYFCICIRTDVDSETDHPFTVFDSEYQRKRERELKESMEKARARDIR
jgi:hypothetical protein